MNIAAIVSEIDAEIDKLRRIRDIVQSIRVLAPPKGSKRKRRRSQPSRTDVSKLQAELLSDIDEVKMTQPQLIVLPARRKREYRLKSRPTREMPRALARAPSTQPVFVPRSAVPNAKSIVIATRHSDDALEAAVRKSLMGTPRRVV